MYSFEPTDEQKMLIDAVRRYAVSDLRPAAREADEESDLPQNIVEKGWELGLLQASVPEDFGGFGEYSALTGVLAMEEMAWGDLAGALAVMAPAAFALPILLAGSPEQKEKYLAPLVEAEWKPYTAALLENRFDFDPQDLTTTAKQVGEGYVLDGEKVYVPYADRARLMVVYARLGETTQGFIVSGDAEGLEIGKRQPLMGIRALPVYTVNFKNVQVSAEDRLGGPEGHDINRILESAWVGQAALAIGLSRAAFEYSRDYAKEREVFGVKVAQKQAIAFMLAEMATEIESIRLLTWEAAWALDNQKPEARKLAYLALSGAMDMAMMVTDRAVQILGGHGYIREHPVEMWMRNGRGIASFTGLALV